MTLYDSKAAPNPRRAGRAFVAGARHPIADVTAPGAIGAQA